MLKITADAGNLLAAIRLVSGARSKDATRPTLLGVSVRPVGPYTVRFEATDGHALVRVDVAVGGWEGRSKVFRLSDTDIQLAEVSLRAAKGTAYTLSVAEEPEAAWPETDQVIPPRLEGGPDADAPHFYAIGLNLGLVARVCAPLKGCWNVRWQFTDDASPVRIDAGSDVGRVVAIIMPTRL